MRETGLEIQSLTSLGGKQDQNHTFSHTLGAFLVVNGPDLMLTVCQNGQKMMKEEEFEKSDQRDWP